MQSCRILSTEWHKMKERLISETKKAVLIFVIGIAYLIWVLLTDIRIPCVFHEVTGLLCPACGITRMIAAAARLDFVAAYSYNKLIFLTWPIIVIPLLYSEIRYVKIGERNPGKLTFLLWIEIVLFLIFGLLRNL